MGKITDEELKKIEGIRKETTEVIYALGELEYQKTSLDLVPLDRSLFQCVGVVGLRA